MLIEKRILVKMIAVHNNADNNLDNNNNNLDNNNNFVIIRFFQFCYVLTIYSSSGLHDCLIQDLVPP
jgi:hypothetical protein